MTIPATRLRLLCIAELHPRSATRPPLARAVGPCSVVAQGDAVEVGVTYGFMVFGDGSVALNSPRGIVPGHHKAALRVAISVAHRAATAEAAR